jgi:hypothetical protein
MIVQPAQGPRWVKSRLRPHLTLVCFTPKADRTRYRDPLAPRLDGIAAIDLFVVPTTSFRLLYGLLIMGHGRRRYCGLE